MGRGMQDGSFGACILEAMSTLAWPQLEQDSLLICDIVAHSPNNKSIGITWEAMAGCQPIPIGPWHGSLIMPEPKSIVGLPSLAPTCFLLQGA